MNDKINKVYVRVRYPDDLNAPDQIVSVSKTKPDYSEHNENVLEFELQE